MTMRQRPAGARGSSQSTASWHLSAAYVAQSQYIRICCGADTVVRYIGVKIRPSAKVRLRA